jgi:hypothetical protein
MIRSVYFLREKREENNCNSSCGGSECERGMIYSKNVVQVGHE